MGRAVVLGECLIGARGLRARRDACVVALHARRQPVARLHVPQHVERSAALPAPPKRADEGIEAPVTTHMGAQTRVSQCTAGKVHGVWECPMCGTA